MLTKDVSHELEEILNSLQQQGKEPSVALVKARLKEMSAYRRLLGDLLKKLPASASSHSYVVMEEVKESSVLPLDR